MRFPSIICVASINSPWHVSSPLPSVMIYINTNYVSVLSMNTTILLGKELKELFYIVCNYFIVNLIICCLVAQYLPQQCIMVLFNTIHSVQYEATTSPGVQPISLITLLDIVVFWQPVSSPA